MSPDDSGSVTHWLGASAAASSTPPSRSGSATSPASSGWPRPRLRTNRRPGAAEDEEDAARVAFDSFCRAATRN